MPADTCSFSTGQYTINALTGPVSTGTCGDRVVVKDAYTFTMTQNHFGPGNCTYTIYADSPNVTKDGAGNIITQNVGTYPDEWVITPVGDNKYTIARKDINEAWTDPEGPPSCEHQLYLTPLTDYVADQQKFTIVHVGN